MEQNGLDRDSVERLRDTKKIALLGQSGLIDVRTA